MANNHIDQVLESFSLAILVGSQKDLECRACILDHTLVGVFDTPNYRVYMAVLDLDQLSALWITLPEVAQAHKRSLDEVVVEDVALDRLHSLGALRIDLVVAGKLIGPVCDTIYLFFVMYFLVFSCIFVSRLHLCQSISDDLRKDIMA